MTADRLRGRSELGLDPLPTWVNLTGFDQGPDFSGKTRESADDSAKSSAFPADPSLIDPDLARILDAWPTLAEPIRRAVLALVESASPRRF
jgi:hypothetical protein